MRGGGGGDKERIGEEEEGIMKSRNTYLAGGDNAYFEGLRGKPPEKSTKKNGEKHTHQETPNGVGGQEANMPDASNNSYGTATDQFRQYRSCCSRNLF